MYIHKDIFGFVLGFVQKTKLSSNKYKPHLVGGAGFVLFKYSTLHFVWQIHL